MLPLIHNNIDNSAHKCLKINCLNGNPRKFHKKTY